MGVKIVIPANSYDGLETTYPTEHSALVIEEYVWNIVFGMEQFVSNHYQHLTAELKRVGVKWFNVSQLYSFLRLRTRNSNL